MKKREVLTPFALPEELESTEIEMNDETFTITAHCTRKHPCCLLCGTPAQRFHSQLLPPLPSGGTRVCLQVLVRKCFCDVNTCVRKIFAERLAPFVEPLARVTTRLFQVVQALGLATGGMLGARLAERIGIKTSWMTVLRRIMALPVEPVEPVRELGIDDFAWKRGRKWGTILVDMQSHKVIDILPDRSAETAAAWIASHPEIELVSRDRGGDYASAAKTAAPQAAQCADRFHVLKNLGEALEGLLARHLAAHRRGQAETSSATPLTDVQGKQPPRYHRSHPKAAELSQAKREERFAQYEQVVALRKQGFSQTAIANRVRRGQHIHIVLTSVNRDARIFPDPDTFLLERKNRQPSLTFGSGQHLCMGIECVFLLLQMAIPAFFQHFPAAHMHPELPWTTTATMRYLTDVPFWPSTPRFTSVARTDLRVNEAVAPFAPLASLQDGRIALQFPCTQPYQLMVSVDPAQGSITLAEARQGQAGAQWAAPFSALGATPIRLPLQQISAEDCPNIVPTGEGSEKEMFMSEVYRLLTSTLHLSANEVHASTDFFDAGGNSLTMMAFLTALRLKLDLEVEPGVLFEHPQFADLATTLFLHKQEQHKVFVNSPVRKEAHL